MTYQAQITNAILKGRYNLPYIEQVYKNKVECKFLTLDERTVFAAMLALADSTEAPRDERYPASEWMKQ